MKSRHEINFGADPALLKARFRLQNAEVALRQARQAERDALGHLKLLMQNLDALRQQKREAYENISECRDPASIAVRGIDQGAYLSALRERIDRAERDVADQQEAVHWERHRVAGRMGDVNRAMATVRALEKLRDQLARSCHRQRLREEERQREDDAMLQFCRASRRTTC